MKNYQPFLSARKETRSNAPKVYPIEKEENIELVSPTAVVTTTWQTIFASPFPLTQPPPSYAEACDFPRLPLYFLYLCDDLSTPSRVKSISLLKKWKIFTFGFTQRGN
ncbi:hypothetical protein CDAR_366861 [Caerostris darwini]|uniref:Uncharacterized protein n=1 Tax=Caerostris darwini TaxID=1538125 RepID=A0AAV4N7H5_9ARAC|nr:hypothetical protein CDAR_366861 [Caerostris darwini]